VAQAAMEHTGPAKDVGMSETAGYVNRLLRVYGAAPRITSSSVLRVMEDSNNKTKSAQCASRRR